MNDVQTMIAPSLTRHPLATAILIGGEMIAGNGQPLPVIDPATGEAFALAPAATRDDLDRAVAAARAAFPGWTARSPEDRRAVVHAIAARLRERAEPIGALLTAEQGKPLGDAIGEIRRAADHIEALTMLDLSDQLLREDARERVEIRYRPLGVVGGITPWNVPVMLAMVKVAQALYTGNTIILKPSPFTPLSTLAIGQAIADIAPAGTVNIVSGGNDLGAWITSHPGIDKISFTGTVATGRRVLESAAGTFKRVTLELGGNDPAIILPDADLDLTAEGIVRSAFANCGQVCMAIKRVFVHASLYDAVVEAIATRAAAIRTGPGTAPDTRMGPIQNRMQFEKVVTLLREVKQTPGARIVTGGTVHEGSGYFIDPTIVTGLPDDAPLVREEQFGPVLPILRYDDVDDAIARANATEFGLGASVWTRDLREGARVAGHMQAGLVWVNRHGGNGRDVPFGGAKYSGYGREQGVEGMRSYMEMQVVTVPVG
ncbi:aldehyde dehydrogenase family protein [Sphingobium lignivorans]|uniref:Acyl-CoA reductase-like NAD-dependent aldehyde dehydrogenase n=1 Tax=Sphingobium lignivorans TaxID=2735886 RepID=A0ABR6NBW4_9SPHN|nr:aldehyde dehydrogenase family protein [Sphingobium lignivorans]MBB5984760.1 acyl-CoA reductase-like NAD-dependent aldehyde dehydrogenase [Sphingobium lignivorans]